MKKIVHNSDKTRKIIGLFCFLPAVCFLLTLVYYLVLLAPLTQGHPLPDSAVSITSSHYNTLFVMLAISSIISAAVLIYCVVHIVRLTTINAPTKALWILLLVLVPVSFIVFWYKQIRTEPPAMLVDTDIS